MRIKIILDVDNEDQVVFLEHVRGDENNLPSWVNASGQPFLKVNINNDGSVNNIEKDTAISAKDDVIISQFIEQYQDIIETESSGISADDDSLTSDIEDIQPYDPELIRVDTKPFSLKQVYELMEDGDIDLSTDFQRHFVWKEAQKKSRLIESIMLRIPLPVFYLSQDKVGKFQVVDGLQRLTVINQFLNNKFKLHDLEYLKECEGSYYNSGHKVLDPKYIRRITQTQLVINIIDPQTPNRVKFEIFKRLNQGGKPLRPQEIRNCMASTLVRDLINEMANSNEFLVATDNSVNPIRMEDQELVLRYVGFYYSEFIPGRNHKYTGYMESFLDETLNILNNADSAHITRIRVGFTNAMLNSKYLFGYYAFRKCLHEHLTHTAKKQLINKSLFTAWSVVLSEYDHEFIKNKLPEHCLNLPLADRIEDDGAYYDALSFGTNDLYRIQKSFEVANELLSQEFEKYA